MSLAVSRRGRLVFGSCALAFGHLVVCGSRHFPFPVTESPARAVFCDFCHIRGLIYHHIARASPFFLSGHSIGIPIQPRCTKERPLPMLWPTRWWLSLADALAAPEERCWLQNVGYGLPGRHGGMIAPYQPLLLPIGSDSCTRSRHGMRDSPRGETCAQYKRDI